jgi:hypothetical protein
MLTEIGACNELFHTATGTAYADLLVDGHRETWPIRSKRFRGWLRRRYYQATGDAASAAEIRSALDLLEARAQFDGPERAVHVRVAEHRPTPCAAPGMRRRHHARAVEPWPCLSWRHSRCHSIGRCAKQVSLRRLRWNRESADCLFRLDHASRLDQLEAAFKALGRSVDMSIKRAA